MRPPSGANTALLTTVRVALEDGERLAVAVPQPRGLVAEAVRMRLPSGANTAPVTLRVWPPRVASGWPSRSHSRAVLSLEAVRMRPPSGANTALLTRSVWPSRVASGLPSRVPQPRGVVARRRSGCGRRRARTPRW